jgi:alpha-1,2-mannosyltransferase
MTGRLATLKKAFSEAPWLDAERTTNYPRIFVFFYVIAILLVASLNPDMIDMRGEPVGTDFMNVWSAGKMAQEGRPAAAYDYQQHYAVQKAALPYEEGQEVAYYAWHYPPMFLIVAAALALLPYGGALLFWMAATLPLYLAAIRRIIPGPRGMMAALAFPAAFVNLGHGQNGFFTAALLGGALLSLEKRPVQAGILFGLLAYKPQFGLLIPLALLAGGHWRAIFSAAITVIATAALSAALFGVETWQMFFRSLKITQGFILEEGATGWWKIQSIFSAVRMFGASVELAYAVQAGFAVLAAAAVIWAWRRPAPMALKAAALSAATLMVTPYVLDYDLIVLALPIAWMAAAGLRGGFLPWEKFILFLAWLLPLLARMLGQFLHLPVAPLVMALLLWIVLRRIHAASEK